MLEDLYLQSLQFLHRGGPVMWWLAVVCLLMWICLLEHRLFLRQVLPELRDGARALARRPPGPWTERLRRMTLSRDRRRLQRSLPLVRSLVTVAPLLGLLGTVSGMIQVFDTLAILGNADPKALSAGISRAVLTTMAGLVVALPGMYMVSRTERRVERLLHRLFLDSVPAGEAL